MTHSIRQDNTPVVDIDSIDANGNAIDIYATPYSPPPRRGKRHWIKSRRKVYREAREVKWWHEID